MHRPPGESPEYPDSLAQLPHGRHGLPPEFVEHNQRERLIASFVALVGEIGYSDVTITATHEGAGVSSRTFYKFFETIEDCFIAAYEKGIEELRPIATGAYASETKWPLRMRAVLAAVLADFADYPAMARVLTTEPFVVGPEVAKRHQAIVVEMVPFLRQGRELRSAAEPLPETTERGLLGAASSLVARQVVARHGEDLPGLLPDLAQFVLTPYLGAPEARRIALG